MAAKNKANLSQFVGKMFIRSASGDGTWLDLPCVRGVIANVNSTNQSVDVITDDCGSIFTGYIPEASMSFTFLENADTTALAKLFWLTESAIAAGAHTITDKAYTFDAGDDTIVLDEISNDGAGFGTVTVKSSDWATTYADPADYTVAVDAATNTTTITRVGGGTITAGEAVLVTATGNVNASSSVSLISEFKIKDEFEVKIVAMNTAKNKIRTITIDPATLEADYAIEFLDVVKAGDINGASLEFMMKEGWTLNYYDEILTDTDV